MLTKDAPDMQTAAKNSTFDVRKMAERALSQLAIKAQRTHLTTYDARIELLCEAVTDPDESRHHSAFATLIAAGATSKDIFDSYIPDAARRLGSDWLDDTRSFSDVTIGSSRLQQIVRNLGRAHEKRQSRTQDSQRALIAVPQGEQHVLGAFIAAHQLRRAGFWVHIALDANEKALVTLLREHALSVVGISAATPKSLDTARSLISVIRRDGPRIPIALGGPAALTYPDRCATLDVDVVATNVQSILDLCDTHRVGVLSDALA